MSDDLERRIREGLSANALPGATESLRQYLAELPVHAAPPRAGAGRLGGGRGWWPLLPAALLLVGIVALAGGASVGPTPTALTTPTASVAPTRGATPSPSTGSLPAIVDDGPAHTVGELLTMRADGQAEGGPFTLRGYWTDRSFGHSCTAPIAQPGELEVRCHDGEWGITELDEEILSVDLDKGRATPASGPHLTPWIPSSADQERLFNLLVTGDQRWGPVPIVVVGHFDDPAAADCQPDQRQLCLDRFVIDRIVSFDPESVAAPTPSPTPTPFPHADPPPALFKSGACYGGAPKSFSGWARLEQLNVEEVRQGYVYAMVTRDVIPIGSWYHPSEYPGHDGRWWGQGVCMAWDDSGAMQFTTVIGTKFLELDDGRHIPETTAAP